MPSKVIVREAKAMAESEAKKAWRKENTVIIKARLQRSTDADIIQYLEDKSPAGEIKRALRLLIEMQKDREA